MPKDFQRVKLNEDIDASTELDRISLMEQLNLKKRSIDVNRCCYSNQIRRIPLRGVFGNMKTDDTFEKTQFFNAFFSSVLSDIVNLLHQNSEWKVASVWRITTSHLAMYLIFET